MQSAPTHPLSFSSSSSLPHLNPSLGIGRSRAASSASTNEAYVVPPRPSQLHRWSTARPLGSGKGRMSTLELDNDGDDASDGDEEGTPRKSRLGELFAEGDTSPKGKAAARSSNQLEQSPLYESEGSSRRPVPQTLRNLDQQLLEVYKIPWETLTDEEILRKCADIAHPARTRSFDPTLKTETTSINTVPPTASPKQSHTPSPYPSPPRSTASTPSIASSSININDTTTSTVKPRPRVNKRLSTQAFLSLTNTRSRDQEGEGSGTGLGIGTGRAESAAAQDTLFPPSPPAGQLRYDPDELALAHGSEADLPAETAAGMAFEAERDDRLYSLRVMARVMSILGGKCARLEEENAGLREKLEEMERGREMVVGPSAEGSDAKSIRETMSIHDNLAEALSTSLKAETDGDDLSTHFHSSPHRLSVNSDMIPLPNGLHHHPRHRRPSSLLSADVSSIASKVGRAVRSGSVSSQVLDTGETTGMSTPVDTPLIVVRPARSGSQGKAAAHGRSVPAPGPKQERKRKSWTSSLLSWNGGDKAGNAAKQGDGAVSPGEAPEAEASGTSKSSMGKGENAVTFEPRKARASISVHNSAAPDDEENWRYGEGRNSPGFIAIVQAARVITAESASVLHRPSATSSMIAQKCHHLVANAQASGASLKTIRATLPAVSPSEKRARSDTVGGTRKDDPAHSPSIGSVLTNRVQAILNRPAESNTARNQLLRSISSHNVAGTLSSGYNGAKSPERAGPSSPMLSPTSEEVETPPPSVELNSFIAPKDRPPTMLPRRNTFEEATGVLTSATRFGEDTSDLARYTDRYGFVYDLGYVKMLLELKTASAEEDAWVPRKRPSVTPQTATSMAVTPERSTSASSVSSSAAALSGEAEDPKKDKQKLSAKRDENTVDQPGGTPSRPRSSTLAAFNPSPARASATQQEVLISSRGSINLSPVVTAADVAPDQKGSLRLQKDRLDSLASRHKTPVSSLLSRLSDVHDVQEKDTLRKWEQFLKYRKSKSSRRNSTRQRAPSVTESGSWHGDLVGIANVGSGKTGQDLTKRFVSLVHHHGIPIGLRAEIWSECSGAKEAYVPGEYREILAVHEIDKHPILGEIEKDVKRTFPTNVFFGGDGVGCEKLRRVLTAFAWHDPSIGYCQGMNLVAATLLLIYQDEERAYWTFVAMVRNLLPEEWFSPSLQGSMAEQRILEDLVKDVLPKVGSHFEDIGLEFSAVTFGWMLSLFTSCLPIEASISRRQYIMTAVDSLRHEQTLLRFWDCFMVEGRDVIVRSALAILKIGEDGILQCENVADLFDYLHSITERMWSADRLINTQTALKTFITSDDLAVRRQRQLDMASSPQ